MLNPSKKITEKLTVNMEYAKDQEEYLTLPAHVTSEGVVAMAFELTDEDIENIKKNKKVFLALIIGNRKNMIPLHISTSPEAFEDNVEMFNEQIMPLNTGSVE